MAAAQPGPEAAPPAARAQPELTVDSLSVVKVKSKAVANARSGRTLGPQREGTGVVIDSDGLVLTIGYLIVEAETVELSTADGRSFPATVVGYDNATGFGLLKALRPLPVKPVQFGQSASIGEREMVLIVGFDGVAPAYVVSRRPFVGYWEYLLDEAIYTAPATVNWSGAALLNREGKLLGIGSLVVGDAMGTRTQVPGNLFVPIDLLKPMLGDLIATGKSSAQPAPVDRHQHPGSAGQRDRHAGFAGGPGRGRQHPGRRRHRRHRRPADQGTGRFLHQAVEDRRGGRRCPARRAAQRPRRERSRSSPSTASVISGPSPPTEA